MMNGAALDRRIYPDTHSIPKWANSLIDVRANRRYRANGAHKTTPQETTQSDVDLALRSHIEAAATGDPVAFEALYNTFAGRVRAFAAARGAADPDGIANEVMLRVFKHLESFDGTDAAFTSWVFTIARNCIIDAHRAKTRRPDIIGSKYPDQEVESAESTAVAQLAGQEFLEQLVHLTADQREVVALRILDDLSIADVARITGKSQNAVKSLQRRGLERLQEVLLGERSEA